MSFITDFPAEKIGGKFLSIESSLRRGHSTAVFYAVENARYHLAGAYGGFFLYLVTDRVAARRASRTLSAYLGEEIPVLLERDDVLINKVNSNNYSLGERMKTLAGIRNGDLKGVVVSCDGLLQCYPSVSNFDAASKRICVGDEVGFEELLRFLAGAGYRRNDAMERGNFSVKGDTVYIFGYDTEYPFRIELFGDTVESIKTFDSESMKVVENVSAVVVLPATDVIIPPSRQKTIMQRINAEKKTCHPHYAEKLSEMQERFTENASSAALGFLTPYFREETATLFDYLPDDAIVVLDDVRSFDDKIKIGYNSFSVRVENFITGGEASKAHLHAEFSPAELYTAMKKHVMLGFMPITSANPVFEPQELYSMKSQAVPRYFNDMEQLVKDIKAGLFVNNRYYLYCNPVSARTILDFLQTNYVGAAMIDDVSKAAEINVLARELPSGVVYPSERIVIIGQDDMVRRREVTQKRKQRKDFVLPEKGDYVVHEVNGIGISEGMQSVKMRDGTYCDYYVVLYHDGDRLYLPASQLDTLEKYSGADAPTLHKLGGKEFARVKEKTKQSIKKLTIDLLKLYEKRMNLKGFRYQPDTVWQKEMEDAFEFEETPDQLTAISEIKNDMEKGRIMDRLLCGDVGYGKTEVALRAIFKTVLENKQAVFLAPTTILAQQHYNTLCSRFNDYKLNIVLLSRFVPQQKINENLKLIKSGKANIVVATHRVLSKDVEFADLGLLVLDEEQRFGVEHKEKIKALRNKVNVLSLSATPIPRTLHMAMSGIRDISVLETPPTNRMPVETYVTEYSDSLLMDAVNREYARGGQVFILYNKVATIESFYKHVVALLGDIPVIYAHGQMDDAVLEDRIKQFYDREAAVMISTTIIENGIDLPYANTLIVIDADTLGLAQLYQLRGRVGRSNVLAYTYFTVREGKVLTENATKRLEALMEFTDLGSGFKVAMRDLDIRGAGNVLGKEQSGQMERVGYDMYCKMIQECLDEVKGKTVTEKKPVELTIDGNYSLPGNYVSDSKQRILFYKKVSSLASGNEAKEYLNELRGVYGEPPESVTLLMAVTVIKNLAIALNIRRVIIGANGTALYFYDDDCLQNQNLMGALSEMKDYAVLSPVSPPQIIFQSKKLSQIARVKRVLSFLSSACKDTRVF